jgi:hypothetical protein
VAWSCFRILASNDASRISMVMVGSLGLRVRERQSHSLNCWFLLAVYVLKVLYAGSNLL